MDIGQKIKQLRIKNGLTQEELASRTELSKGFLSQLERDLTSPSIATLEDIVCALGSDLENFFKEETDEQIIFKSKDYFIDEQENCKIAWIVPNAQKNEMEPILLELPEHGISQEVKPHEGEELGYVLQGKVVLVDLENNFEWVVKKGETFYIKGDYLHCIRNDSAQTARLLWVTTPPIF